MNERSHSHLLRDDLRGPLLPIDGLSHISRINGWNGSDSWVEGCRKDRTMSDEHREQPEPKLPYRLLSNAYHEGAMRRASEVVYIQPSKRGVQHAKIDGVEYPDIPDPPAPGAEMAPRLSDQDAKIAALTDRVDALTKAVEVLAASRPDPENSKPAA